MNLQSPVNDRSHGRLPWPKRNDVVKDRSIIAEDLTIANSCLVPAVAVICSTVGSHRVFKGDGISKDEEALLLLQSEEGEEKDCRLRRSIRRRIVIHLL